MPEDKTKAEILIELEQAHKRIAELESSENEKRLRSMLEISQVMSASLEMDIVLQKIIENAAGLLQLESGAIYTLVGDELFLEATTPPLPPSFPDELRHANVADHPHIQTAISNGSSVVLADSTSAELSSAEKLVAESRGLRSIVYVPLMISEKAIGVFIVASVNRVRTFSEEEIDLYSGFSGQAAQTIENVRLFRSEHEYAAELEAQIAERKQMENNLRESERKYRDLINGMNDAVWVIDMDMRFLDVNDAAVKALGYSRDELLFMKVSDIDSAIKMEQIQQLIDRLSEEKLQIFETRHKAKDGREIPIEVSSSLVSYMGRTVIMSIARDVTDRKQAEEEARLAERRYRALIENAPDGVVLIGMDGKFKYASPAIKKIFGYEQHEAMASDPYSLTHPDDLQEVVNELAALIEDPSRVSTLQYRFKHKNGEWRWIESIFSNLLMQPGIEAIIINFRDIHERRLAEEALRKNEERLRTVADFTYDMEFWVDENKTLLYMSPSCKRITGYEQEQFLTDPSLLQSIVHPEDRPVFEQHSTEGFDLSDSCSLDFRIITLEGEMRWISHTCQSVTGANGKFRGRRVSHRDITERRRALQELRASEEKYRGLLESLDSVIATVDPIGKFLYMNDKAAEQLGGEASQFIGKTMYELFPEQVANKQMYDIQNVIEADRAKVLENLSFVNGQPRWYRTFIQPLHDEAGQVASVLVNSTDIHALKMMQQELQELNRTLEEKVTQRTAEVQDLYENAPTGYHSVNPEGKFVMVNQTELNWLGYTREEMLGHTAIDFITEATRGVFRENFPLLIERGWVKDVEFDFVRKDGSALPVSLNATSIYDEAGNFIMTRSTVFDNTERKVAENTLRESEATYRALFENSNDGIFLMSSTGEELRANQRALDMLGYTLEEYLTLGHVNQNPFALETEQRKDADDKLAALLRGETVPLYERIFTAKDGHKVPVEVNLSPVRDANGTIIMVQSVVRDIAERKAAEAALRNINKELQRALLVKDEFLANMSHELRTPLNGILGFSEILLTGEFGSLNEKQYKYISTIESSGKHLLGLINDLLDLAKIEADKLDITLENVVISELCQASLMFVKQIALNKNIQLSFEQDMTYPYVVGDQRRLKQILVNLLSNAVKFTPEHGKVTLRVTADSAKDCLGFAVEDTGIGVSQADLLRLFKPFTQVDSSLARQHEGTGLGLALVQKLAELHGGGVSVQSEVGRGSTFTVCIPGRSMIGSEERIKHQLTLEHSIVTRQGVATGGKILLAEDMESNIVILGDYLEHQGYELIYARNGEEALEKAKETLPDLILMDIQMPVMDGLAATRRLRTDPRFATVPIIALTALAMIGDRERCLEAGATEYVSKPTNLKKLKEMIASLLKAKA